MERQERLRRKGSSAQAEPSPPQAYDDATEFCCCSEGTPGKKDGGIQAIYSRFGS